VGTGERHRDRGRQAGSTCWSGLRCVRCGGERPVVGCWQGPWLHPQHPSLASGSAWSMRPATAGTGTERCVCVCVCGGGGGELLKSGRDGSENPKVTSFSHSPSLPHTCPTALTHLFPFIRKPSPGLCCAHILFENSNAHSPSPTEDITRGVGTYLFSCFTCHSHVVRINGHPGPAWQLRYWFMLRTFTASNCRGLRRLVGDHPKLGALPRGARPVHVPRPTHSTGRLPRKYPSLRGKQAERPRSVTSESTTSAHTHVTSAQGLPPSAAVTCRHCCTASPHPTSRKVRRMDHRIYHRHLLCTVICHFPVAKAEEKKRSRIIFGFPFRTSKCRHHMMSQPMQRFTSRLCMYN
jgi:hypothetical protein